MHEAYGQLAAVSAVLGGFVISFLAVLASNPVRSRRVGVALVLAVAASAAFVVAALGWSLFAAQSAKLAASSGAAAVQARQQLDAAGQLLGEVTACFLAGVALLFVLLGTSGWLHSRRTGWVTATLACLFALSAIGIVGHFVV